MRTGRALKRYLTSTQQILSLRQTERRRQDWLGPELGLPQRTVSQILRRHHPRPPRRSDERDRPGELIHMSVKKIGEIRDGGGWKTPRRQHSQTSAQKKARTAIRKPCRNPGNAPTTLAG